MISILIPAYNEEGRIGRTVRALTGAGEILVVDDGSQDQTANEAEEAGARVLRLSPNRGKGGALMAGLGELKGEVCLFLDADLGETARHALALADPILRGEAEMTVARLPRPETKAGVGLVLGLARWGLKLRTGQVFWAPLSGQRGIRLDRVKEVLPLESGFGIEVGLNLAACRRGWRIAEIPLPLSHRETGRDWAGIRHRARQGWAVFGTLVRRWWG